MSPGAGEDQAWQQAATVSAGECGVEDQVGRTGASCPMQRPSRVCSSELSLKGESPVEIVVKGRHYEVTDRFRAHVEEKLSRLEKYDQRIIRVEVEVCNEPNPRLAEQSWRVEITIRSRGPVIRAEAAAEDKMAALDKAVARLSAQARKASDRRRIHRGSRTPVSLAQAMAAQPLTTDTPSDNGHPVERKEGPITVIGDGPLVVREKSHPAEPMELDDALYEMELVGHDFFLFIDKETSAAAVVYRRKGYNYGVIRLDA
jgi:ribosomal subunit interface protein